MFGHSPRFALAVTLLGSALLTAPAQAADPTLLGSFKSWSAFSSGDGDSKVCYALSQPTSSLPKKTKRDPIYFLINDWPGRKAKAEPEVVPGYQYKDGSQVTAQVGADKFIFFTKNDGGAGAAWVLAQADEQRLIEAMKNNAMTTVTGESKRGTMTHDSYSLAGFSDALDKIHQTCGM